MRLADRKQSEQPANDGQYAGPTMMPGKDRSRFRVDGRRV